ncbi:hypothetical protein FGB62_112g018 [Gracilaria domingensis]|nr:hypothetical protein FGB62_112g018 [Gracilaria domingensis]
MKTARGAGDGCVSAYESFVPLRRIRNAGPPDAVLKDTAASRALASLQGRNNSRVQRERAPSALRRAGHDVSQSKPRGGAVAHHRPNAAAHNAHRLRAARELPQPAGRRDRPRAHRLPGPRRVVSHQRSHQQRARGVPDAGGGVQSGQFRRPAAEAYFAAQGRRRHAERRGGQVGE